MVVEYSYLKRLAYDSKGLQKKKSVTKIIRINIESAAIAWTYSPADTDIPSRLPKPGRLKVFDPNEMISAAVRKYHPLAQDKIPLYTNLGMLAGI
jgi:hypothetical protein